MLVDLDLFVDFLFILMLSILLSLFSREETLII